MSYRRRHIPSASSRLRAAANGAAFELLEGRQLFSAHIAGSSTVYSTIQAAVNAAAPGAVINVDPGTYSETVTVNKTLTIRGAQAGVDARLNTRTAAASESIVNGSVSGTSRNGSFLITANDVTIDGFTVQGNTLATGSCPAGIVINPKISGTHILDNVIQNNVTGLYLANFSSTDQAVIQRNIFRNNNNPGNNSDRGIYSDGGVSGGNLTNVLIDSNMFVVNSVASGGALYEGGIALESRTANSQSNITITNNVMDGTGKLLIYNASNINISYNVITHSLDQWSGTIRFEGGVTNAIVEHNTVFDNTGLGLSVDAKGFGADDSGVVAEFNNFYNNNTAYGNKYSVGVTAGAYDGTFDATNNYWGSATGPSGQFSGSGDQAWGNGAYFQGTNGQWSTGTGSELVTSPFSTTPSGSLESPYFGIAPTDGAAIQAEDYDNGGEGIGYHDTTSGNGLGKYRTGEGVDIEASTDTGGGYDVGTAVAGEWLKYTVNVTQTGTYRFDFRVSNSQTSAGKFHLEVDGVNVTGSLSVPPTGGTQTWTTVSAAGISLSAGTHVMRIVMDTNGASGTVGNFNWFKFTNTGSTTPAAPSNLTATAVSATQINLLWGNNATNQTGFKIERSTDGSNFSLVTTVGATTTTFSDTGLTAGTKYYYEILATNGSGDSAPSNIASATTQPASTQPTYLSDLTWTSATAGFSTVQKDESILDNSLNIAGTSYAKGLGTHAVSQIVYSLGGQYNTFQSDVGIDAEEDGKGQGSVDFQVIGDGTVLYDSGVLTNDQVKHINISIAGVQTLTLVANNGVANSIDFDHADWGNAAVFGNPSAPAAPSNLSATVVSSSSIKIAWQTNSANQTNFKILRSTDGTNFTTIATNVLASATSFTDTNLGATTKYYYEVIASNAVGDSAVSNIASATTTSVPPTYLSDLTPVSETTGFGTVQDDASIKGTPISLRGTVYAKGIGTHADSTIVFNLAGQYSTFVSDIGIDDDTAGRGSVDFQVLGDGKVLYDSGIVTGSSAIQSINISVAGVQQLTLQVTTATPGVIDYDHADWAGAALLKS